MIKLLLTLLLVCGSFADQATITGSREWGRSVYFGEDLGTTILLLADSLYMDSANTGTFVQVGTTADSCSQAVKFISGSNINPTWKYELGFDSRVVSGSPAMEFDIETRDNDFTGTAEDWVLFGRSEGYGDKAIVDSVLSLTTGSTSYLREKHLFFVTGREARFCPNDLAGTTADSLFIKNMRVRVQ